MLKKIIAITHLKSAKDLKLIVEEFANSIDHQGVNRQVRHRAPALTDSGAFEDEL